MTADPTASHADGNTPPRPNRDALDEDAGRRRAKEKWSDAEQARLVQLLRDGVPLEDVAEQLGRGHEAVSARCRTLLPPDQRVRRGEAEQVLRARLVAEPDFDWRAGLRADAARRGRIYWDPDSDHLLRDGWTNSRPLVELVAASGGSELEVAARLVELDVAGSTIEVARRLGYEPGGTLDVRVRMTADRAAAAVWVLVADGLRTGPRPLAETIDLPARRHVSLHANEQAAQEAFDRLLTTHGDCGGDADEVAWTLAERVVGHLAIGRTRSG
jgi:transposase-like protein